MECTNVVKNFKHTMRMAKENFLGSDLFLLRKLEPLQQLTFLEDEEENIETSSLERTASERSDEEEEEENVHEKILKRKLLELC